MSDPVHLQTCPSCQQVNRIPLANLVSGRGFGHYHAACRHCGSGLKFAISELPRESWMWLRRQQPGY